MTDQKNRPTATELRETWWREWWRLDFSWDQLAKKRIQNWYLRPDGGLTSERPAVRPKQATLQDLWRAEEGRLVTGPDNRRWTIVHAPWTWADGTPAKQAWDRAQFEMIEAALEAAVARMPADDPTTEASTKGKLTPYARAKGIPLDGAVFGAPPVTLEEMRFVKGLRVSFMSAASTGDSWEGLYLRSPLFEGQITLEDIEAGGEVRILDPLFLGGAVIAGLRASKLTITNPQCLGDMELGGLEITDAVSIGNGRFDDDFTVDHVSAPAISFVRGDLSGDFAISTVTGNLTLNGMKVAGDLDVNGLVAAKLSGQRMQVSGNASFKGVTTSELTSFLDTIWSRRVTVSRSNLEAVEFDDAEFAGKVSFTGVDFSGKASFARAHFENGAYFGGTKWTGSLDDLQGAFRETRFESFVDFRGSDFTAFSAFDGANFKSEIRFDHAVAANDKIAKTVLAAAQTDKQRIELEHGFRVLKQTAESARNRNLEQAFFRYELLARRSQSTTLEPERTLSWLYGASSDYGASFVRPVGCAVLLWVVFTPFYLLLGKFSGAVSMQDLALVGDHIHPAVPEAIGMSARSMFNLFGIWGVRPPDTAQGPLLEIATLRDSPLAALLTRLVSSVQSLLAGILLFLAALAARRRFQIN
jgi:uncharacterized protein YjbI with pentapeptide repeats